MGSNRLLFRRWVCSGEAAGLFKCFSEEEEVGDEAILNDYLVRASLGWE